MGEPRPGCAKAPLDRVQSQLPALAGGPGIHRVVARGQSGDLVAAALADLRHVEVVMAERVAAQVGQGEVEEVRGGAEPFLLQVDVGPGELDQPLVEIAVGLALAAEPELLEDVVGLVVELPVEAVEIARVVGAVPLVAPMFGLGEQRGDLGRFLAQKRRPGPISRDCFRGGTR